MGDLCLFGKIPDLVHSLYSPSEKFVVSDCGCFERPKSTNTSKAAENMATYEKKQFVLMKKIIEKTAFL